MDGLEAVELKLSKVLIDNDSFRFDSEYFKKKLILFYKDIKNFDKLGSFVKSGYRVVYENTKILDIPLEKQNEYTRFLQASDLSTPEIILNKVGFVDNEDWKRYKKGRIEKGELLIEVKGKAEKVAIVYEDIPEKILISGSLFKLKVNNKITKEYLLTFLLCKYGEMFKNRSKTNLLIAYISKPDLYNIPVPIASKAFQLSISNLIQLSHEKLMSSKQLYKHSKNLLLKELDLLDFEPSKENVSVKSFSESFGSSGRLDSEYYLSKYAELIERIEAQPFDELKNIVTLKKSIETGSEAYSDNGVEYIRVSNLTKMGLSKSSILIPYDYFEEEALEKLQPKKNTILLSKDGTVGIAYSVKNETNIITSGAILHLTIKNDKVLPEYLTLVLNSMVVQMQSQRDAGGSIIKHWKPSEISKILIPIIDKFVQIQIEEKIKESFRLKEDSEKLLVLAKRGVEVAIEEGEEVAMEYLNLKK